MTAWEPPTIPALDWWGEPPRPIIQVIGDTRVDTASDPDPGQPRPVGFTAQLEEPKPATDPDETHPKVVHQVGPDLDAHAQTTCCGRTLFELPRTDRVTEDPDRVTCKGVPVEADDLDAWAADVPYIKHDPEAFDRALANGFPRVGTVRCPECGDCDGRHHRYCPHHDPKDRA